MTSRALPPPKKKSRQPDPTTILALGDDLLREVFLRLPSLSSLVRAALACPAFLRAVRSSPVFRRRFRDLHWPPLLGVFLVNEEHPTRTFVPVLLRRRRRRSHPDHAAALRGFDVFLTLLPDAVDDIEDNGKDAEDEDGEDVEGGDDGVPEDEDEEDAQDEDEELAEDEDEEDDVKDEAEEDIEDDDDGPGWSMCGCSDGYVLLVTPRWNPNKVAVYHPVTRDLHVFPAPPDEMFSGECKHTESEFHVVSSEADDRSFRVLCVSKEKRGDTRRKRKKETRGSQVAVFSLDTREWQISPTTGNLQYAGNGTLVNGFVYWTSEDGDNVLNTATLQFSRIDLPPSTRWFSYGETNDGKLCLVGESDLELDVWVRRAGDDGVDTWMQDMTFEMSDAIDKFPSLYAIADCPEIIVEAIIGGIVYFSIHQGELDRQDDPPIWLMSFCLETEELKKLCRISSYEFCYPYSMAWPPSLVRNKAGAV